MLQLMLFRRLPIPRDAVPWRRRPAVRRERLDGLSPPFAQLAFTFRLRELESDRDTEFDFPRWSSVPAGGSSAPSITTPRTVFEMATRPLRVSFGRGEAAPSGVTTIRKVETGEGVTRTEGAAYPVRWTAEDEERERRRRARQRPPKPTKKARTRGRKLMDLIGIDDGNE